MNTSEKKLLFRIQKHEARVGVIGMGYVGLPLAMLFAKKGFPVTGFDIDGSKVKRLMAGKSYIHHIASQKVSQLIDSGRFRATSRFSLLHSMDAIIICVPTPLTEAHEPDLSFVEETAKTIGRTLRPGQLIILESTTYPGTTEEVVRPILKSRGKDFFLAYSPEREDPGNPRFSTETIPRVVGGVNAASKQLAQALYKEVVVQVVPVNSARTAEATKMLENIYRCVNIALVNELKMLFDKMGMNVWEVIRASSTKPFGFQPFEPGPGLGGHCIPIDPFYLSWKAREYDFTARFIELAGEINSMMPSYVADKTEEALRARGKKVSESSILILGMAYKKDVDDIRESPSLTLVEILRERGARVCYNDPFIPKIPKMRQHRLAMRSRGLSPKLLRRMDCVIVATAHSRYNPKEILKNSRLIVDTRGLFTEKSPKIVRA